MDLYKFGRIHTFLVICLKSFQEKPAKMAKNFGQRITTILLTSFILTLSCRSAEVSTSGPHYLPPTTQLTTSTSKLTTISSTVTKTTSTLSTPITTPVKTTTTTRSVKSSSSTPGPPYLPIRRISTIPPVIPYVPYTYGTYKPVTFKYYFTPGPVYYSPVYRNFTRGSTTTTRRYPYLNDDENSIKYFKK